MDKKLKSSPIVITKLPRSGLGNLLFAWAQSFIFSHKNNIPFIVYGWGRIKLGPWLRGENSKRLYTGIFRNNSHDSISITSRLKFLFSAKNRCNHNAKLEPLSKDILHTYDYYSFSGYAHWSDYFKGLKEDREIIKSQLYFMLRPTIMALIEERNTPIIGMHIRMGDFRSLKQGEDFSRVGHVRTPISYFIHMLKQIRSIHGSSLPCTVFSDGHIEELTEMLSLPNVTLSKENKDIVDLLLLSRSKIIVTSAGSTFSYWAGFLSDAPIIMHPDHIHNPIRDDNINSLYYEGYLDEDSDLLLRNIRQISIK